MDMAETISFPLTSHCIWLVLFHVAYGVGDEKCIASHFDL